MKTQFADTEAEPDETSPSSLMGTAAAAATGGFIGAVIGGAVSRSNGVAATVAGMGALAGAMLMEARNVCQESEDMPHLVGYLRQHLGPTTTAYLSGPGELPAQRLRSAFQATHFLVEAYGDTTANSWFLGTNDLLDCESPAWVLRHGQTAEDWEYVIPAARQAVENAR
jgi:hypothetical protein